MSKQHPKEEVLSVKRRIKEYLFHLFLTVPILLIIFINGYIFLKEKLSKTHVENVLLDKNGCTILEGYTACNIEEKVKHPQGVYPRKVTLTYKTYPWSLPPEVLSLREE